MAGIDLGTLSARVTLDTAEATKNLQQFNRDTKSMADNMVEVGKSLLPLSVSIGAVTGASVMASASAGEMMSKFNAVFKESGKEAQAWADTYANAIGRSKYEIREAIANQSDLMIGMGFTEKQALSLSTQYTELAYNLASFNNVNDATAIEAVTKAMMGETEMMKQLGVNLLDGTMKTSEFVKASGKKWEAMTMQERATAYLNEATKQSTNAMREENGVMGDASITALSFTNQLKAMKGKFHELSVAIGNVLVPILTPLLIGFNGLLSSITFLLEKFPLLTSAITFLGVGLAIIPPTLILIGKSIKGLTSLHTNIINLRRDLPMLVTQIKGLPALIGAVNKEFLLLCKDGMAMFTTAISTTIPRLISSLGLQMATLQLQASLVSTAFLTVAKTKIAGFFATASASVIGFLGALAPVLGVVGAVGLALGTLALVSKATGLSFAELGQLVVDGLKKALDFLLTNIPKWLEAGKEIVMNIAKGIMEAIPKIIEVAGNIITSLMDGIAKALPIIQEIGMTILNTLIEFLKNPEPFITAGTDMLVSLIDGFTEGIIKFTDVLTELIDVGVGFLTDNLDQWIDTGINLVMGIIDGMLTATLSLLDVSILLIDTVVNGLVEALPKLIDAGIQIITTLLDAILQALPQLIEAGITIITTLLDAIITALPQLIDAGIQIFNALLDGLIIALPQLIDAGITICMKLVDALVVNLPKIIDAGIRLLEGVIDGLIRALPQLIEAGLKIIVKLVQALIQNLPKLIEAGVKLLEAIIKGILQVIGKLAEAGLKIIVKLAEALVDNFPKIVEKGKEIVGKVVDGVTGAIGDLIDVGAKMVTGILDGIKGAWSGLSGWVGDKLSALNPFKGKAIIDTDVNVPDNAIEPFAMSRAINLNPSHFGFNPKRVFDVPTPSKGTKVSSMINEAKEVVINTVVELEGYQIAKASARYMQEELSNINRKATRLGGVL